MPNWIGQPLRFLFLLFLATVSLIFAYTLWKSWQDTLQDYKFRTQALVDLYAQTTRDSLRAYEAELRVLGETLSGMTEQELQGRGRALLERVKERHPGLAGFGLARPDGQLVLVTDFPPGVRLPNLLQIPETRDSFREALQSDHLVMGRTYFFRLFYEWIVPFRFTIHDEQGQPRWVIASGLLLGSNAVPGASLQLKDGQGIALLREDGYLQSQNPQNMELWYWIFTHAMPEDHMQFIRQRAKLGNAALWHDTELMAVRFLPEYKLYAVGQQTLAQIHQQFLQQVWPLATAYLGLLLLGYGAYRLARFSQRAAAQQRELHVQRMQELALRDTLTGLPNRQALRKWLDHRMSHGQNLGLQLYSCELFYLDRIVEDYGYSVGESLIRTACRQLQQFLPDSVFLARVEERRLTLVVPEGEQDLNEQKLQAFFRQVFDLGMQKLNCPAILACVRFPEDGQSAEELEQASLIALAEARKDPHASIGRFNREALEQTRRRARIANRLQSALDENRFTLVYQPQVDLNHRTIVAMEALLRWQDEELGTVSPLEFIPVAEEMGVIHQLGQYVIRLALSECCEQRQKLKGLRLAVNVCADELNRLTYWTDLKRCMEEECWPAQFLELEITERLLVESTNKHQQAWEQCADLGIRLAIDDFGTGYSSLAYLAQIPAQMMKIDRLFVDSMMESENYQMLVRAMVVLGQSLGLDVLAEGVETRAQLLMLQELGCDQAQGYFIARPMPMQDLLQWLESQTQWLLPKEEQVQTSPVEVEKSDGQPG